MKKWRIIQHHPEDRYEPDDELADGLRQQIREKEAKLKTKMSAEISRDIRNLQIQLAERLYGK